MIYKTKYNTLTFLDLVLDTRKDRYFLNDYIDIKDAKDKVLLSLNEERVYYISLYDYRKKRKAYKVLFDNKIYWIAREDIKPIK